MMKPELYEEVQLICAVPSAELEVGDRAILIDYLEHPDGGETGAVLELSQSLKREQYVVTVPVGAIAILNQANHAIAKQQEISTNRLLWSSVWTHMLNLLAKLTVVLGLGK